MSNVTLETLTRAEAHRKLLALGMPANVAADYLGDDPPFVARSMVSLAYPGAWPILEAYQRHCKSKAAIDPLDTVPPEERERIRKIANESGPSVTDYYDVIAREVAAYHARTAGPEFQPAIPHHTVSETGGLELNWTFAIHTDGSPASAEASLEALFAKWAPLLSPYLNGEQLADLRRDIVVDNHPRHRDGNCNDCGAPATKGSASMGQFCARCAPAELPDLETRSAPVPVAVAADRLASGHVQRLRDGTWEWCHDGGFDNGVVTFSPATNAWLSEVVKDANQPGLTGDAWTSLVRTIATLAENDSLVDDAITATERAGCPGDVVLHLREINDAMYRRRMRGQSGQSGITWSTAIKVAIALAPHGDVTAQAQTVMRIAGKHHGITEEAIDALHALAGAICATQGRDPEQKAQLQRIAEAHDAIRYAIGDKYPAAEDAIPPVRFPGDVSIPRAILERLAKAAASDPDAREARWAAERILQRATLAAEPARTDPEAARQLAEARAERASGDASLEADDPSPIERLAREFDRAAFKQGCGAINHDRGDCYRDAAKRMRAVAAEYLGLTEEQAGNVQSVRRRLGLTQERLGVEIGYRSETISRWENGHEAVPRVVRLALIGLIASHGEHDSKRGAK